MCVRAHRDAVAWASRKAGVVEFEGMPNPDDLLILLTVARLGRFTAVADSLGTTHTTVSRRIAALEKRLGARVLERSPTGWELTPLGREAVMAAEGIEASLGSFAAARGADASGLSGVVRVSSSDALGATIVAPALAQVRREHPRLQVELLTATRRLSQNRTGVDLELVPGTVDSPKVTAVPVADYSLRLFAGRGYAAERGIPASVQELHGHDFVSYVETSMQIHELSVRSVVSVERPPVFQATSIYAQVEAVARGAGIGLLPDFLLHDPDRFVPVLPGVLGRTVRFWATARPEAMRSPAVLAVLAAIVAEGAALAPILLPPVRR